MYLSVATLAYIFLTAGVYGGVIPATYNLIQPAILPQQALTFAHANNIVHSLVPVQTPESLAHPAVVQNAIAESQLPSEFHNRFYKDPNVAANLARESWLGDKEYPVLQHRDTDDISRSEIAKIVARIEHRA